MSYAYEHKQRNTPAHSNTPAAAHAHQNAVPNSVYAESGIFPGNAPMSAVRDQIESTRSEESAFADKGHRIDLDEAMRAKMESAFGMNLSALKLYESQSVEEASANAMARGNEIIFAPGKADFTSQSGQELLGHELSHVASQARGEVRGNGLLLDHGLEARADREGAMAARGETVYSGPVTSALSSAAPSAMSGGVIQANWWDEWKAKREEKARRKANKKRIKRALKVANMKEGDEGYIEALLDRKNFVGHAARDFLKNGVNGPGTEFNTLSDQTDKYWNNRSLYKTAAEQNKLSNAKLQENEKKYMLYQDLQDEVMREVERMRQMKMG